MYELSDMIANSVEFLEKARGDEGVSKEDVVEGMRKRLCVMMGKVVAHPVVSNFALPCVARESCFEHNPEVQRFFSEPGAGA